jgi:hypothetical protein
MRPALILRRPLKLNQTRVEKHVFGVRATDAAGNADSTPATDDFKLKRKRRR